MPRKKEPSSHSNSQDGTLALSTSEDQPSRSPPPTSQPTTKKSKKERKEADAEDQSSGSTPSNSQSKTKTKTKKSKKERKPTDTISETTDKFLLGEDKGSGGIDNDLDNLFQSSVCCYTFFQALIINRTHQCLDMLYHLGFCTCTTVNPD